MRRAATIACILSLCTQEIAAQSVEETLRKAAELGYVPGAAASRVDQSTLVPWIKAHRDDMAAVQSKVAAIHGGAPAQGCIGKDKLSCAASIGAIIPVGDDYRFFSLFPPADLDVNGRELAGRRFRLTAIDVDSPPGSRRLLFELRPSPDGRISEVRVFLPADPMFARTPAEYEKTKLYEAIAALAGTGCPQLTPLSTAQWFENMVKPTAKFGPKTYDTTVSTVSVAQDRTAKAQFCSRRFEFHSIQGVDPNLVSIDTNPTGRFAGMQVIVR